MSGKLLLCCGTFLWGVKGEQTDIGELSRSFDLWELRYQKMYSTAEDRGRAFETWVKNSASVEAINANAMLGWRAKVNAFADISPDEFSRLVLMKPRNRTASGIAHRAAYNMDKMKPAFNTDSYDWREHGAVTAVQDQGSVGSCWAFSTIGNIEGQWFLSNHTLIDLSEEYLVDCDGTHDDTHADCGVFGGWPYLAYQFLIEAGGVPSEETWPYCSGNGGCYPCMQGPISLCGPPPYYWYILKTYADIMQITLFICNSDKEIEKGCPDADIAAAISDWQYISDDESDIADALLKIGPLSTLLDATQLQFYDSGVWTGHIESSPSAAGCKRDSYNHAVLLVGYGSDNGVDYWTVKNSWSDDWGENGYFRIVRGESACGINGEVTSAVV